MTNIVADSISRPSMEPTYNASEKILKGPNDNDYIHGKQGNLTRVISQLLYDKTYLGTGVREHFDSIFDARKDIALFTIAENAHD